jgi:hypothetical protein
VFNVMELRVIRHSVTKMVERLEARLKILDPQSDDAVEIENDLPIYRNVLKKINDSEDV